jgi:hypothetical protein
LFFGRSPGWPFFLWLKCSPRAKINTPFLFESRFPHPL